MQIYIGSDHAGYAMKEFLQKYIRDAGHNIVDLGTFSEEDKVDYPDIAREVGEKVIENEGSRGILICGTGLGMSIAANKMKGIRAAVAHDVTTAKYARLHNNANIITMGQRIVTNQVARDIVDTFLSEEFEGGRHEARIEKIMAIEND